MTETTEGKPGEKIHGSVPPPKPVESIGFVSEIALISEKLRIQFHKRKDPQTERIFEKIKNTEDFIDKELRSLVLGHPTTAWWTQIRGRQNRGLSLEIMGKVLGTESEGTIYLGHFDNMCKRWAMKLFLSHLWVVWRRELGLGLRVPYAVEHLGDHTTIISPEDIVERSREIVAELAVRFLCHSSTEPLIREPIKYLIILI